MLGGPGCCLTCASEILLDQLVKCEAGTTMICYWHSWISLQKASSPAGIGANVGSQHIKCQGREVSSTHSWSCLHVNGCLERLHGLETFWSQLYSYVKFKIVQVSMHPSRVVVQHLHFHINVFCQPCSVLLHVQDKLAYHSNTPPLLSAICSKSSNPHSLQIQIEPVI